MQKIFQSFAAECDIAARVDIAGEAQKRDFKKRALKLAEMGALCEGVPTAAESDTGWSKWIRKLSFEVECFWDPILFEL